MFLKKVVPSCLKCKLSYRFSKTLENTYEKVQFSEVTGLEPATLLKIDSFIDMKQRGVFTNICHILSVNLISVGSCSYSNNGITQLIKSI